LPRQDVGISARKENIDSLRIKFLNQVLIKANMNLKLNTDIQPSYPMLNICTSKRDITMFT